MKARVIKIVKMKNIEIIMALFLGTFFTYAQTKTISIEEYGSKYVNIGLVQENITEVKDINNVLDKYVGTWIGESNGKKVTFFITEITQVNNVLQRETKFDILVIKHKTEIGNVIIDDTTGLEDTNPLVINGYYIDEKGYYVLNYTSRESDCAQSGRIYIEIDNSTGNLISTLIRKSEFVNPEICDGVDVYKFIPENFTLIRQ